MNRFEKFALRCFGLRRLIGTCFMALCATGCANLPNQKVFQMFDVKNIGEEGVVGIAIEYGGLRVNFCNTSCRKNYESGQAYYSPIQEKALVKWKTLDGREHRVEFSVRDRIVDFSTYRGLTFKFDGADLYIFQQHTIKNAPYSGYRIQPLHP